MVKLNQYRVVHPFDAMEFVRTLVASGKGFCKSEAVLKLCRCTIELLILQKLVFFLDLGRAMLHCRRGGLLVVATTISQMAILTTMFLGDCNGNPLHRLKSRYSFHWPKMYPP